MQEVAAVDKDFTLFKIKRRYGSSNKCAEVYGVNPRTFYAAVAGIRGISNRNTLSREILNRLDEEGLLVYEESPVDDNVNI